MFCFINKNHKRGVKLKPIQYTQNTHKEKEKKKKRIGIGKGFSFSQIIKLNNNESSNR